jgi:hypothetical protein
LLLAFTIPALAFNPGDIERMIFMGLKVFIVMSTIIIGLISYIEILILKKMGTYIDKNIYIFVANFLSLISGIAVYGYSRTLFYNLHIIPPIASVYIALIETFSIFLVMLCFVPFICHAKESRINLVKFNAIISIFFGTLIGTIDYLNAWVAIIYPLGIKIGNHIIALYPLILMALFVYLMIRLYNYINRSK